MASTEPMESTSISNQNNPTSVIFIFVLFKFLKNQFYFLRDKLWSYFLILFMSSNIVAYVCTK